MPPHDPVLGDRSEQPNRMLNVGPGLNDHEQETFCQTGDVDEIDNIDDQIRNFCGLLALFIAAFFSVAGLLLLLVLMINA